jgi:peptidyl-prolyl cis-trans isomerase SurA
MTENRSRINALRRWGLAAILLVHGVAAIGQAAQQEPTRVGDYIVAVVNSELVTAIEVEQRAARLRDEARRAGARTPAGDELRRQIVDSLIDERVLITHARESGIRIDDAELDRAVSSIAAQNKLSLAELRQRLAAEGTDMTRFRGSLRDQMQVERIREREVSARIRINDTEIEGLIAQRRSAAGSEVELNLAQILVTVAENSSEAATAERRARIDQALARIQSGANFEDVAREVSEDANRAKGGEIGMRPISRLPDLFVEATRELKAGQVAGAPVRSGAGFHLLKVLERREGSAFRVTQTRARHVLLRTSAQFSTQDAARRLEELRRQIEAGQRRFEDVAREVSEDGSAASGGDLGWVSPGGFVPEFEEAMNRLSPGGLSPPVASRFGVHLIQVLERRSVDMSDKEVREQARNVLREQKFEAAYVEWAKDLRARAYIELREPPQ